MIVDKKMEKEDTYSIEVMEMDAVIGVLAIAAMLWLGQLSHHAGRRIR